MRKIGHRLPTAFLLPALILAACASGDTPEEEAAEQGAGAESMQEAGLQDPDADSGADLDWEVTAAGDDMAAQDMTAEELLAQDFALLTLEEQKKVVLVDNHLRNAADLRARLRFEDALAEVEAALTIDPDSLEAKRQWNEIGALLGRAPAESEALVDDLRNATLLKKQALLLEAKQGLQTGRLMLARGDYDGAIAEFTLTLDHIRWNPYSVDWQGVQEETEALLARAKSERTTSQQAQRDAQQRDAFDKIRQQEVNERNREQALVNAILAEGIAAFERGSFDEAQLKAEEVLRKDPRNQKAAELRDSSFRAGRVKVEQDFVLRKREQFRRWEEEMAELAVPWDTVIQYPDPDFWARITEVRKKRRGIDLSQTVDPTEVALRKRLQDERTRFDIVDEESLMAVIDQMRTLTGLPLVVHPLAEEAALDFGAIFDLDFQNSIAIQDALSIICEQAGDDVTWTVQHEAVVVTTTELARGRPIIYNHDIQDLVFGLTEFFGPRIDRIRLIDEMEDDDGNGPFGTIGEHPKIIEPDDLATLVQENVSPDSWDLDGVSIAAEEGFLIVVNTPEVQNKVRKFLEDLRRFSSSLVTIESKFMNVEDNWLQEIGVEFRGLDDTAIDVTNGLEDQASLGLDNQGQGWVLDAAGPPSAGWFYDDSPDGTFAGVTNHIWETALGGTLSTVGGLTSQWTWLDDSDLSVILTAVEKSESVEVINNQTLSVHNTQRAYVTVVNQQAYIQDFDVEVAQFQAVADPVINVLIEGIVLDVRPTIHYNRKYLTLEVQPTVAQVVDLRDFSTTLGGNTSAVQFQLPELEVASVFTTAIVPDGGSILLGGLSRLRNIERRAEVPWLANIPIVGFFFKSEGYNDEKQSLMIMLTAWITDVKEEQIGF